MAILDLTPAIGARYSISRKLPVDQHTIAYVAVLPTMTYSPSPQIILSDDRGGLAQSSTFITIEERPVDTMVALMSISSPAATWRRKSTRRQEAKTTFFRLCREARMKAAFAMAARACPPYRLP